MKLISVAVLIGAILPATSAMAAETAGFAFLDVPVGARAVAMGGAFTGMTGDPNALYWNPAALASVSVSTITSSYTSYLMDMQAGFVGWVGPRSSDVIGVSANYFYGGSFVRTTMSEPQGTGEEFSSSSIALSASYARSLTPCLSAGVTGRFVYSSIDTYSGSGAVLDLGAIYSPPGLEGAAIGLAVRNAGIQTKAFYEEKDPMPTEVAAGASYRFLGNRLVLAADLTYPFHGDFNAAVGTEYTPLDLLSVRLGTSMSDMDAADAAGGGFVDGMSFGMGTRWHTLALDYAFRPFADLGSIHRISLNVSL
ncbi:PorV/PorQ family protein [Candidatus Fermentibacterales bacterium]|nr:PorV/PorQ family protein [Candidatus Fermentibacterales bacterium]